MNKYKRELFITIIGLIFFCWSGSARTKKNLVDKKDFTLSKNQQNTQDTDSANIIKKYFSDNGKYLFTILKLKDSLEFVTLHSNLYEKELVPFSIGNMDSIKKVLKAEVYMHEDKYGTVFIERIKALNGKERITDNDFGEGYLVAYYPEYNFLLMEGGYSSEIGYDLTTGKSIEEAGNPADKTLSPSKKYRISGIYGGQECSSYIIQEYKKGRYQKIAELKDDKLCYMKFHFWLNDTVFYYSEKNYSTDLKMEFRNIIN